MGMILCLDDLQSGCYYYRTKLQYERLGKPFLVIKGENENINPKDFDTIVYNRIGKGDPEEAIATARKYGMKIIYDCDDALDLIPRFSPAYQVKKNIHFYYTMLREADLITTSTEYLKKHLQKFTDKPIEIRENKAQGFLKTSFPKNEIPRIGFAGSLTHIKDIQIALKALIQLQKDTKFEFYLMGFSDTYEDVNQWVNSVLGKYTDEFDIALGEFIGLYSQIENARFLKAVDYTAYPVMLSYLNLDVGLCPLEDTEFNRCKSSIKAYEYMEAGARVVASNVVPYQGLDIELANTSDEFCDIIKELIFI